MHQLTEKLTAQLKRSMVAVGSVFMKENSKGCLS